MNLFHNRFDMKSSEKSKNPEKKAKKVSGWKKVAAVLSIAWVLASCDGNYSYVNWEFEQNPDNPKEVRGRFNIHFDHSEGSAWYNTDNYNIDVIQGESWYIVKINGKDKYKVGSLKEAEDKICELIYDENESFVHEKYIQKAEKKTARFTEKYDEYQNNPNRPKKRTVSLKDE